MSRIVPVRSGARYLVTAPGSLHAQSYARNDLVVVDTGGPFQAGSTGREGSPPAI